MAAKSSGVPSGYVKAKESQGWKRHGGGEVRKWTEGMEVEGIYRAFSESKATGQSPIITIDTKAGSERFWCPAALTTRLEDVEFGTRILIVCLGKSLETKRGTAWDFDIFTK